MFWLIFGGKFPSCWCSTVWPDAALSMSHSNVVCATYSDVGRRREEVVERTKLNSRLHAALPKRHQSLGFWNGAKLWKVRLLPPLADLPDQEIGEHRGRRLTMTLHYLCVAARLNHTAIKQNKTTFRLQTQIQHPNPISTIQPTHNVQKSNLRHLQ